jgi:dUTP pyrophosphatase
MPKRDKEGSFVTAIPKMPKSPIDDFDINFNSFVDTVLKVENKGFVPSYQNHNSAAADLFADLEDDVTIEVGKVSTIKCGFSMDIPFGYKVIINPNEELANKGFVTLNGPIGSSETGELNIIVGNLGDESIVICRGDKFAKMMIEPTIFFKFVQKDDYLLH